MNDQCNECKIRKMCYREEPEEDWTCEHYEPCDDLPEEMEEIEEEEGGADTTKLLEKLLKNNDELLESNQRLITLNEQLVEVNNGWNDLASKMFALLTKPTEGPKRGKWIDTGENEEWYAREYRCSECGDTMLGEANFCPNCGAKMEVEHDE